MNKKVSTILLSCLLLLISAVLLIVFLIIPNNISDAVKPLTISSQDYNLSIGEEVEYFYTVSKDSAVVSFEVENPNIVEINGRNLIALKPGKTKITIKASEQEEMAQMKIEVNVYLPDYSLDILPIYNCLYQDNKLYCDDNICQFKIEIIDKNNQTMTNVDLKIKCEKGEMYQEFTNWTLIIEENCKIIIYVPEINFQFIIDVILIK